MPKVRVAALSLIDAQRHINVFRARINKTHDYELMRKIDEILVSLHLLLKDLPLEEKSITDKQLDNAIVLIDKEKKKTIPKIDLLAGIRAIYSTTNGRDALNIGLKYGFDQEQIKKVVQRAPNSTNLGKAIAKIKPIPIPTTPTVKRSTIDSDGNDTELDNELKAAFAAEETELDEELKAKLLGG